MIDPLPRRGLSGLPVPAFGPLAAASVLLPLPKTAAPPQPAVSGKRKAPSALRLPGQRGNVVPVAARLIPSDDGTQATFHTYGRTAGAHEDGAALLADALLTGGVLRETDWCGSVEKSLWRGLTRFVNDECGAARWRFLNEPLSLVYTDDGPAYSTGVRLPRWTEHFKARPDRPIGFFGLRFQSYPKAVHVRRVTERLEAAYPGVGYGLLNLLEMTFITAVQGYGPMWGKQMVNRWKDLVEYTDPLGELYEETGSTDDVSAYDDFHATFPEGAFTTPFRYDKCAQATAHARERNADLAPVLEAALSTFNACRRAGKKYFTLNHCPFLSWQMSVSGRRVESRIDDIEHLDRAPVVYTVWDSERDAMTRLVDDYTEYARSTMRYTDLTWMHCFQRGFAGCEPPLAKKQMAAHERKIKKLLREGADKLTFYDPDYVQEPMPDGSLSQAVMALVMVMDILSHLDRLLSLLHTSETLAEQARMEDGQAR